MSNQHMVMLQYHLIIRDVQIKTVIRYNLTPARMATSNIYKTMNDGKDVESGTYTMMADRTL